MTRPSRDSTFLAMAEVLGMRGTCDRAKVGAILTREGRCVSWGYNGAPPGLPHCDENRHGWLPKNYEEMEPWVQRANDEGIEEGLCEEGCINATHAEANALAFAARQGISTEGCTLYTTVAPCDTCSRLLIAAGIVRVVAAKWYRDPAGMELLAQAGVEAQSGTH